MNSMIKTKQITRGAMVCAIYGVLLFANQQLALALEDGMSWIFAFPILIYAAQNPISVSVVCAIAMILETFLFGGFTTWFYSWTSITIGLFYGIGICKQWSNSLKLTITFFLSAVSYLFIFWLWAGIFGLDYTEDFELIHQWLPFLDLRVFMGVIVFVLSLLQTICIHLLAIMICLRMKIKVVPMKKVYEIKSRRWVGVVFIILLLLFFLSQILPSAAQGWKDLILLALIVDLCALDYYGIVYMLNVCIRTNKRKLSFFAILGGFIPLVNIVWIVLGELDCLLDLRRVKGRI